MKFSSDMFTYKDYGRALCSCPCIRSIGSGSSDLTVLADRYIALTSTVEKLEFSDVHELVLSNAKEKIILRDTYTKEFSALRDHLVKKNIFSQRIWYYSGKIYAKEHPKLGCFANTGTKLTLFCLAVGGIWLISAVVVPVLVYSSSWKVDDPWASSPTCIFAALLWFLAAYVCNLGCLFGMLVEESKLDPYISTLNGNSSRVNETSLLNDTYVDFYNIPNYEANNELGEQKNNTQSQNQKGKLTQDDLVRVMVDNLFPKEIEGSLLNFSSDNPNIKSSSQSVVAEDNFFDVVIESSTDMHSENTMSNFSSILSSSGSSSTDFSPILQKKTSFSKRSLSEKQSTEEQELKVLEDQAKYGGIEEFLLNNELLKQNRVTIDLWDREVRNQILKIFKADLELKAELYQQKETQYKQRNENKYQTLSEDAKLVGSKALIFANGDNQLLALIKDDKDKAEVAMNEANSNFVMFETALKLSAEARKKLPKSSSPLMRSPSLGKKLILRSYSKPRSKDDK